MKIVHVEGGLGNQMACYAVYVAVKAAHPDEDIYIDTYLYDIEEAHSVISMWNGYELERVFGVKAQDIRNLFTPAQVDEQISYLTKTKFWLHDWNYAEEFVNMMKRYGFDGENAFVKVGDEETVENPIKKELKLCFRKFGAESASSKLGYKFKALVHQLNKRISSDCGTYLLKTREGNCFYDITLDFMKSKALHEKIGESVRENLQFVEPLDERNEYYMDKILHSNSVSIHVRRTDYLKFNDDCYKYGYFKNSVKYVKAHVINPVFFIFSDDLLWCEQNKEDLGLSDSDIVIFVDANSGSNSYRDMQLMACCKHNIATKSSFGWWGSFLNKNPNKITCCQISQYISTNQF